MHSEDVIISKVLSEPNKWEMLVDAGLKPEFFLERRPQISFIQAHYTKYGTVPSSEIFQDNYPAWEGSESTEPIEYWVERLRKEKSGVIQNSFVEEWLTKQKQEADPDVLGQVLIKAANALQNNVSVAKDVSMRDTEREKKRYKEKREDDNHQGILTGLTPFDNATMGARSGDLGVIMAPPENFKTWLLCYMANHIWTKEQEPTLVISKEMTEQDMQDRMTWLYCRFPFEAFLRGVLGQDLEERYFDAIDKRSKLPECIISADDGDMDRGGGVSLIAAKIEKYKPSVVLVDGAYLITDDRGNQGWEGTKNVFRDLKRLARSKGIPVIATTQPQRLKDPKTNEPLRRKLVGEDVGSAYTIYQDADWMIGARKLLEDTLHVYKIKNRRGKPWDFQMRIDFEGGKFDEVTDVEEEVCEEDSQDSFSDVLYD